jgi:hypothetical protein
LTYLLHIHFAHDIGKIWGMKWADRVRENFGVAQAKAFARNASASTFAKCENAARCTRGHEAPCDGH